MKTNTSLYLSNGLPIYKMMQYKTTQEQCRIIKINPEQKNVPAVVYDSDKDTMVDSVMDKPVTVDIKIRRNVLGILTSVVIEQVSLESIRIWNESMKVKPAITFRTRKGITRTVSYFNL